MVSEQFPFRNRQEMLDLIPRVLEMGRVQRILMKVGEPLKVRRYVTVQEAQMPGFPEELLEDLDLLAAARNAEIKELSPSTPHSPFELLLKAFLLITQRRLRPRAIIVNTSSELVTWLGLDETVEVPELFGVEVIATHAAPEGSLLLLACAPEEEDPDQIVFTVRLSMGAISPHEGAPPMRVTRSAV